MSDPTLVATAWMDQAWDEGAGLLWNAAGAFADITDGPHTVHLVRETAWYALGLLRRGAPGDHQRAERAIAAVVDQQYDAPGRPWHGTFVRFPEWPAPRPGAVEWVDYDPNWRQFVGTALAVAVTDFDLSPPLADRARAAIALAVDAEPPDRVPPTYANIALLRAWLEAWAGRTDHSFARSVAAAFHRHGCFVEHSSPTYYGIDLMALGLWQRSDSPPLLQELGEGIETALWTDVARWWHAGLGNLCGPYSRAYGMDLHAYVSGLGLALWCASLPAPLPDLTASPLAHGHDLCSAPMLQHVGVRVPAVARPAFEVFPGPHAVTQLVDERPRRVATGWLDHELLVGAEADDSGPQARGQRHPATIHWRRPDGGIGWLRLVHHAPTTAVATPRQLDVRCEPHLRHGPQPMRWETNVAPSLITADRWQLPGLEVGVETNATLREPRELTFAPPRDGHARIRLTIR